jgi:Protein of unknown function (DUF2786)
MSLKAIATSSLTSVIKLCEQQQTQANIMNNHQTERPDLDKLKGRILGLQSKTVDNGCTEEEALAAAAKVAELLDQYDLSLTDVEIRQELCERSEYETWAKQSVPLDGCIPAIAEFTDCRVWREKNPRGQFRFVFFGLQSDVAVAHYLCDLIDRTMLTELARFKVTPGYLRYRQSDRRTISASFLHGMATSIALKLTAMKAQRDDAHRATGRDLVVVKAAVVDDELAKLGMSFYKAKPGRRRIAEDAYATGHAAGKKVSINPGIGSANGTKRDDC